MRQLLDKLDGLLDRAGLNQGELEQLAGLPQGRLSKWKAGQGEPTAFQALRMSRVLDVPLVYLADDELSEIPGPDLTEREQMLLERLRRNQIDPGEVLDLVIEALMAGRFNPAARG